MSTPYALLADRAPEASFPGRVYPPQLKALELQALQQRRSILDPDGAGKPPPADFPADTVGFALSGGGIRSATFCLGVFQALARKKLLGQIDFLSTVSGGGYFGSFYGAWLNRGRGQDTPKRLLPTWLTFWRKPAEARGARAGYFAEVQDQLGKSGAEPVEWLRQNGRYLTPNGLRDTIMAAAGIIRNWLALHFVLTVFLLLAMTATLAVALGLGKLLHSVSWLPTFSGSFCGLQSEWKICWSPLFWITVLPLASGLAAGLLYWVPKLASEDRNFLNRVLAQSLGALIVIAAVAALDSIGCSLWNNYDKIKETVCKWVLEIGSAGAVAVLVVKRLVAWIRELASQKDELSVPMGWLISIGAALLAFVWLAGLDTVAHGLAESFSLWRLLLILLVTAWLGGLHFGFINLSSQAGFYGSRLTRAYLGASNPARQGRFSVSELIPGDGVPYGEYDPSEVGGPLHLVNITVNETVDGRTQTEQEDRKGFNLAFGPKGLSAAVQHHALWCKWDDRSRGGIEPIPRHGFHALAASDGKPHEVQQLDLGQWIGISGAAFTTGLGARTSLGLSFLCGFFNIRLGWWWDSGVNRWLASTLFPVQAHLLDEFRAIFYGSARQHWYLSDGGHFENTAAYELIRRRLPFIVICDDGCDEKREMEDFANLVRKARLDFDAEITVLDPTDRAHQVSAAARPLLGTLEEVCRIAKDKGFSAKPALLARAVFNDNGQESFILLIKPTVTGNEPVDILNYHAANPKFPQESTLDQFFDEAQWESYRKLGDCVATGLFAHVQPGQCLRAAFVG